MRKFSQALTIVVVAIAVATSVVAQMPDNADDRLNYIHPSRAMKAQTPKMALDASPMPFHNGVTLVCGMCHVMHASEQHAGSNPMTPDPLGALPRQNAPAKHLMRAADPVTLCLQCHDGVVGVPDVVGADANGLGQRAAGKFELPTTDNPRGHKLDYGLSQKDWDLCMRCHFGGSFATAAVSCLDCHNPHGNAKARNLQWASWPGGEPDFGLFVDPGATGMNKYDASHVSYGTGNSNALREVTNMCTDCHHVFSGNSYTDPDGNGIHSKHPTYDSERGAPNHISQGDIKGTTDGAHWNDGTGAGFVGTARLRFVKGDAADYTNSLTVDAATNGVFCLSCHKAHGSDYAFGLRWDPSSGPAGKGCEQCHNRTAQ
jgi:hypothetical protein